MNSQKEFVIEELKAHHKISRNHCLRNYISRLSAIILTLKKEGWLFETDFDNGDYVYRVVGEPEEPKTAITEPLAAAADKQATLF
jgi:capsid portal protein